MLQGRYRVVGILGMGGFSSVYQARDMRFPNVTKLCAVKEMINMAPDPKMRAMATQTFEREASILATLDHPAVVDVYDYFTEMERSYLVLEFIRGQDLESLLSGTDDFFSQDEVVDWAFQICDVLAHLHTQKPDPIIFRDLKPSNIMLDPHDRIRLIDFGIAKVFQSEEKNTTIGTEGYAPPEQYRGKASPAGDVYGLGATLHHLLTRQDPRLEPPFSFHERPVRVVNPDVSPTLEQIIMRCVSYDMEERYPDAVALDKALKAAVGHPGKRKRDSSLIRTGRPSEYPPKQERDEERAAAPIEQESTVPPQRGQRMAPNWKFRCEDEIRSAPAVAHGIVYVGVYDNNLYALDAKTGEFQWKHPAAEVIASSPFIYKDAVFIGSADEHIYSIHRQSGRLNWRFRAGGPIYSSPRVDFDHVFFGSDDHHLYAVNIRSGSLAWKTDAYHPIRSSPYVSDDAIFFGTEGGYVFSLDLSGETRWQFQARRAVTSSPTVAEEMVFVGSMDNTVYALDASSGWAIWRFRARRPIISSPATHDGTLYIGSADSNLYALDLISGRKVWAFKTEGQVTSSPIVANDHVYFGSTDGNVYCVDQKGKLRWRYPTDGMVISSAAIDQNELYIGSTDHHLYAFPL